MKYDRNECDSALTLLATHRSKYPGSRHLDEALWFSSRCHWRKGEYDQALGLLRELEEKRPRSSLVPGAAYWQARARGIAGNAVEEQAGLSRLIERWPASGYAWFAAERLGRVFPSQPQAAPPAYPDDWANRGAVRRSQALLAVGLRDYALDELDTLPRPTERAERRWPRRGRALLRVTTAGPSVLRASMPHRLGRTAIQWPSRRVFLGPRTPS